MKTRFFLLPFLILSMTAAGQKQPLPADIPELADNDPTTVYTGNTGSNRLVFNLSCDKPVVSYKIYSTGERPVHDPSDWTLKGSDDGTEWIIVDERKNQAFCSRFQEITCVLPKAATFKQYMLEATTASRDTLKIADVIFSDKNPLSGWEQFNSPNVVFESLDTATEGSKIYHELVQDPIEYIRYHSRKVAEILYYTTDDSINEVKNIKYTLENKRGVSAKGGNTPNIHIFYSTQHIEKSAQESLYKLDFETRGVLYHELTHGYQYEPKGCGNYGNNKTFWACIEGIADAVRAEAGHFDIKTRKPGGNWMDGYRTTGFFIQWLTTKDPDAIRKFHLTVRELDVWSFDDAIKYVFGPESGIESLWNEYQQFLIENENDR